MNTTDETKTVADLCRERGLNQKTVRKKLRAAAAKGLLEHSYYGRWIATPEVLAVLGLEQQP